MVDINVVGMMNGMYTAFPYLKETPGAQVVNLASASAIYGQPELATYSATKFAVRGLTEALELEWRGHDIRVLDVWPLFVRTGMIRGMSIGSTRSLGVRLTRSTSAGCVRRHPESGTVPEGALPCRRSGRVLAAASGISPSWLARLSNKVLSRA